MNYLFLGGGGCQINAIERAKALGHEVILCDYLPDCEGREIADIFVQVSTFDQDAVTEVAKNNDVDGFVCVGTDQPVLTAAVAAERLGKKFYLDVNQAKNFTNKIAMKELFEQYDIPNVSFAFVKKDFLDEEIAHLTFPVVVKPVDSQGQRGVMLLNSVEDVREHFDEVISFSREDSILIEDYYLNDEVTYNGWVVDGKLFTLSIVDRVTFHQEAHLGICLAHNYPSFHMEDYGDEIEQISEKIVEVSGIQNGPVYFQFLIGHDGLKVNEIAARIGGAYEDITIPILSGIDILNLLFKGIHGERIDLKVLQKNKMEHMGVYLSTQLFFVRPGLISKQTPIEELEAYDFIEKVMYHKPVGTLIPETVNATNRAGYMIVRGDSKEDMLANVNEAFELMQIEDEHGENMVIKYGDYKNKYQLL